MTLRSVIDQFTKSPCTIQFILLCSYFCIRNAGCNCRCSLHVAKTAHGGNKNVAGSISQHGITISHAHDSSDLAAEQFAFFFNQGEG